MAGVRAGLAALRTLGVKRSGGTQLYAILETGEEHAGMCFGDGVQYTTGCTFGKGNIRKNPLGKLAFTLIEKDSNRAVRVSYKPTLSKQIAASAFMQKRAAGFQADEIPEAEQLMKTKASLEEDALDCGAAAPLFPGIEALADLARLRGGRMKKGLTLTLEDAELVELCRILLDRDADAALAFLQRHLKGKARDLLEGG